MIETISHINREISKELSIDESLVKSINAFYWKSIRDTVSSGEHTSIRLNSLGTYVISRRKLWIYINKLIKQIRYFRKNVDKVFKNKTREEYIEDRVNELRLILKRRDDLAKVYKINEDKYKLKKGKNDKIINEDLGE